MEELKDLVEKIVEYTKTWSITETEWYWNIDCVRKSNYVNEDHITDREFNVAIRQEILYDLVYNEASGIYDQLHNDLCNYYYSEIGEASEEIEKEIQKVIKDFKIDRSIYKENKENGE